MGIHLNTVAAISIETLSKGVNTLLIISLTNIQTSIIEEVNVEKMDPDNKNRIFFNY